ncbi:MAG: hypothetical protein NTV02_01865 [Candidatus Zambryskibacteria bacterium]|nr:hypothetical protein [Candidatus Zambryskibacteria bacterium]
MTITVFISSFVALLAMIGTKMIEQKLGHFPLWTRVVAQADERVDDALEFLVKKYQLYKKIFNLFVFEFLPSYTYEILVKMKDRVYKKYYQSQSKLKGNKRMLRSNGSVSSFLQDISAEPKKDEEVSAEESKKDIIE